MYNPICMSPLSVCIILYVSSICVYNPICMSPPSLCLSSLISDLIVVIASIVVLSVGSNGQVFATSAIRYVCTLFQYSKPTNIIHTLYNYNLFLLILNFFFMG